MLGPVNSGHEDQLLGVNQGNVVDVSFAASGSGRELVS